MSDLIDRQQAIGALRNYLVGKNVPCDGTLTCRLIENEVINKLPPIQPEIVRCKDCKHWDGVDTCDVIDAPVWDNDFCSMAERRTE